MSWAWFKYIQEDLGSDILEFFGGLLGCNCDGMTCHRGGDD